MDLYTLFPMLSGRWEEGGLESEWGDPLLVPLSVLVVTSLEATELRNVVYDTFGVYVSGYVVSGKKKKNRF